MRVKPGNELIALNVISLFLILIIVFLPSNVLRIIFGLPFILFIPGYTLVSALFPRKADLGGIERVALSFGLSIAVAPLLGIILNYTPWGISLYPIVASIAIFILVFSLIAWYRRNRLPAAEGFSIALNINPSRWAALSRLDKVLSIILLVLILAGIGTLAYIIAIPKNGEKFTEFYILGTSGKVENYPKELPVGEEGEVILGIVNHEHEDVVYSVDILINGENNNTIGSIALAQDEKWESKASFTPHVVGDSQKVEFLLFKQGDDNPYKSLYLWFDVK